MAKGSNQGGGPGKRLLAPGAGVAGARLPLEPETAPGGAIPPPPRAPVGAAGTRPGDVPGGVSLVKAPKAGPDHTDAAGAVPVGVSPCNPFRDGGAHPGDPAPALRALRRLAGRPAQPGTAGQPRARGAEKPGA